MVCYSGRPGVGTGEFRGTVGLHTMGIGKGGSLEAAHLRPRMLDLDPDSATSASGLASELIYPDEENHIAYRLGRRQRLVWSGSPP